MIYGQEDYIDRGKHFYIQTNNPTEEMKRKTLGQKSYLESCGPTASASCLSVVGYNLTIKTEATGYKLPEDECITDFFNSPKHYAAFRKIRSDINPKYYPGNRVPQYYPYMAEVLFDAKANFLFIKDWEYLVSHIKKKCSIQVCLKNPGHYIALLAYDSKKDEIIFNDPWPKRKGLKNKGFNERLTKQEYQDNVQSFAIIYYPKIT